MTVLQVVAIIVVSTLTILSLVFMALTAGLTVLKSKDQETADRETDEIVKWLRSMRDDSR